MTTATPAREVITGVLADREENYYDDSDFYVLRWDGSKIEKLYTWTTRMGCTPPELVWATTEEREAAAIWNEQRVFESHRQLEEMRAKDIVIGRRVRVVRGRKVPLGTEGIVFFREEQTFSPRYRNGYKQGPDSVKLGIALDDVKVNGRYVNVAWTYEKNCEVIDPASYLCPVEESQRIARERREDWMLGRGSPNLQVI